MRYAIALLVLVACASSPVRTELPPIPETVNSALGPVRVVTQDTLRNEQGLRLMGGFVPATRTIYVDRSIKDLTVLWQVLEHERCHVTFWDGGLRNFFTEPAGMKMADVICDLFATARVADMLLPKK